MDSCRYTGLFSAGMIAAICVLLTSCGGGGGGGPSAPSTFSVGGTVSGLVGTVVLQNNGADTLSVSADGNFTFSNPVPSGHAYLVSVSSQPTGPTCSVANGTGTASATVTSVAITCVTDPAVFYLPLSARPPNNGTVGTTGLYALSSKALAGSPVSVLSGTTNPAGYALSFAVDSSGHLSGGTPFALAFSTQNASGGDHLYALDLTAASTLAPKQISSLTFLSPVSVQTCGITTAYMNLNDPSSAFFIIGVPTDVTNLCGGGSQGFKRFLVHLSDSPTTAPLELPMLTGAVLTLYKPDGSLAGFVMVDSGNNLNFYKDATFTAPTVLMSGIQGISPLQTAPLSELTGVSADPTYSFLTVGFPNDTTSLYRIDYSGVLSADLYDFKGDMTYGETMDASNLYFSDFVNSNPFVTETIAQVPLNGSTKAQVLFQYAASTVNDPYGIEGVIGAKLFLENAGLSTGTLSGAALSTVSVGVGGSPTPIASFADLIGVTTRFGELFVTESAIVGTPPALAPIYFTTSLMPDGTVLQPRTANSSYLFSDSAALLQISGATDPTGLGGGTVSVIGSGTSPTVLNDASGAPFRVGTGVVDAFGFNVTATIGYLNAQTNTDNLTYVYDLSKSLMVGVSVPNADLLVVRIL
jgi:hypothetical protein